VALTATTCTSSALPAEPRTHPQPVDADDRWDELLAAVDRVLSQRLALDQLPDPKLLAAEKRGLERRLRDAPPDRSAALRGLAAQRQELLDRLEAAEMRASSLEDELVRMSGLRRFTRRHDRHEALLQVAQTARQRSGIRRALTGLDEQEAALRPDQDRYDAWATRHGPQLDRLHTIERLQRFHDQKGRIPTARKATAEHDLGAGIELGR
jgi:predicted  nucleic acid-binding Zn-ribbon protein